MKFTDEQVMRYVDGEAGLELKTKIMKALEKKDKELEEQVFRFQLANTVMLKHSKEKKEMPELFYAKLRRKRLEKEGSLAKSSISAYSFKNFGRLAFAASIAAFGLLFAYQSQQTNNENLAREFYSSFKAKKVIQKKKICKINQDTLYFSFFQFFIFLKSLLPLCFIDRW